MTRFLVALLALLFLSAPTGAHADSSYRPASVGGYFRIMARPDFQGGNGRLGFWNLYGRLLNEAPWAAVELRMHLLPHEPGTKEPWTNLVMRIEGGSVRNAQSSSSLGEFQFSQLYAEAGNVLLEDVTWRLGTLQYWYGDLGLYDMRPAELFFQTVGLSMKLDKGPVEVMLGVGDSGFAIRGFQYAAVLSGGGAFRLRAPKHFEFGFGGQVNWEPKVQGNRNAPHDTPNLDYEDWVRGEIVQNYLADQPGQEDFFPKPQPRANLSWKGIGYLGFGDLGPIRWNSLFANIQLVHPDQRTVETFDGRDYDLYVAGLTDQRFQFNLGNELQMSIVPNRFDLSWAVLYGNYWDGDNDIAPSDHDREFVSTVLRMQVYLTPTLHILVESSVAREISRNGNAYRNASDSIFENTEGLPDSRGLEFGDSDTRVTWQGKGGLVLNPLGQGIYVRPSLRLLYGAQYSTMNNAFGNSFVTTPSQFAQFDTVDRHWHHMIAVEAEAWF